MIYIIIKYGLITSLLLSVLIIVSLYFQPRIWVGDLTKEAQKLILPKTRTERRLGIIVMIFFFCILLIIPALAFFEEGFKPTFFEAWLATFSMYFIFNLTDLLVIDWLLVCTITPAFIRVNGLDDDVYKNYRKHLIDFVKGTGLIAVVSIITGLINYFISQYSHS